MNLFILFCIFGTQSFAFADQDPQTKWAEQVSQVVNTKGMAPFSIQPGKTAEDLINITLNYPFAEMPDPETFPNGLQTKDELNKIVSRLLESHPSRIFLFFDLAKTIIFTKNIAQSKKINFIKKLDIQIKKNRPITASLIHVMIQYAVFQFAIEEKIIKLSDASYYEFGQIKFEYSKVRMMLNNEAKFFFLKPLNDPSLKDLSESAIQKLWQRCSDDTKDCPESYLRAVIQDFRTENKSANMLQERLEWWLNRAI
jgi:hypothetical protein